MDEPYANYRRPGEFVQGVPARDMTREEWEALPEELRVIALELGIYELA